MASAFYQFKTGVESFLTYAPMAVLVVLILYGFSRPTAVESLLNPSNNGGKIA
jgi:hypothetical protein